MHTIQDNTYNVHVLYMYMYMYSVCCVLTLNVCTIHVCMHCTWNVLILNCSLPFLFLNSWTGETKIKLQYIARQAHWVLCTDITIRKSLFPWNKFHTFHLSQSNETNLGLANAITAYTLHCKSYTLYVHVQCLNTHSSCTVYVTLSKTEPIPYHFNDYKTSHWLTVYTNTWHMCYNVH